MDKAEEDKEDKLLDHTTTKRQDNTLTSKPSSSISFKTVLKSLGPGVITGAADDDPSGIATYSQAGANFGFGMLWMALFQYPMMTVIQEICARIGLITGDGLLCLLIYFSKEGYDKLLQIPVKVNKLVSTVREMLDS